MYSGVFFSGLPGPNNGANPSAIRCWYVCQSAVEGLLAEKSYVASYNCGRCQCEPGRDSSTPRMSRVNGLFFGGAFNLQGGIRVPLICRLELKRMVPGVCGFCSRIADGLVCGDNFTGAMNQPKIGDNEVIIEGYGVAVVIIAVTCRHIVMCRCTRKSCLALEHISKLNYFVIFTW